MENKKVWVVIEEYLHYEMSFKKIIGIFDDETKAQETLKSVYNRLASDEDVDSHIFNDEKHEGKIWSLYDEITDVYYTEYALNVDYTLN